ncbi:hypothetical protein Tco_0453297 [Tanacetum coccineum]
MQRQEEKVNMREAVVAGLVVQKAVGQSQTARIQVAVREIHNTSCGCRYRDQSNRRCEHLLRTQIDALHNILVMNNRILSNSVTNYDTYCWNTNIDSNTTPTSTNYVSLGEGEIDQKRIFLALCKYKLEDDADCTALSVHFTASAYVPAILPATIIEYNEYYKKTGAVMGRIYSRDPDIFLTQSKSQSQSEGPKEERDDLLYRIIFFPKNGLSQKVRLIEVFWIGLS